MNKINKLVVAVVVTAVIVAGGAYFYFSNKIEQRVSYQVIENSKETVKQLQMVRGYYTKYIVNDIRKHAPIIGFDYDHKEIDDKLPVPTTVMHDLTSLYSLRSRVKFEFYSEYPFLNRKERVLTPFQKEAIQKVEENEDGIYVKKDTIDGEKVLRVAIADYMILPACVNCHNTHPLKDWESDKWKLGDKRGVIEIITPLN